FYWIGLQEVTWESLLIRDSYSFPRKAQPRSLRIALRTEKSRTVFLGDF
ncbi:MAG: hypothetical protein ACI9GZ_002864, partial [Bacteroidia bacterium]